MKMPNFNSEEEEVQWYYDNRETIGEEFARAMREGRTVPGKNLSVRERIEAIKAKAMSIPLAEGDLALARTLAERKGLPYQTYIKSLLHEALEREAKVID